MEILVDTSVLIALAVESDSDPYSHNLIDTLIDRSGFNLWVSAGAMPRLYDMVSKEQGRGEARDILRYVQRNFSIIPLRSSTISEAVNKSESNFEDQVQIVSAEAFKTDYIITRNPERFRNSSIPVLTPREFSKKLNAGKFDVITQVPFMDLKSQHHQVYNEIDDGITDIIANTGFILGKHVEEFEGRFAQAQEAKYCIGVSSGTAALHIALMALGIGPGDGVIVPVNTFIATAEAVSLCGAKPVFVDCDEYYNLDVQKLREVLRRKAQGTRRKVKAVIPVHLYGAPANMDAIMALAEEFGLLVVEDCCQAHLAQWHRKKVGNFGVFGAFSFYPGKNLGAYGEAGALITNDEELYTKARMIRQHGETKRYHHSVIGHNYRMEAIQGAVLSAKLKFLEEWTEKRRENACLYDELLKGIESVQAPSEMDAAPCVYHLYVIRTDDRDGLREYLQQNGIATGLHYPVPLHLQDAYNELGYEKGDFPAAEKAAKRILSLPMYPELTEAQIRYVCDKIKEYVTKD